MTTTLDSPPPVVDQSLYRDVVGHFMTGVTVITAQSEGTRYGVTASAVSSLSMDPPMLLVCLNRRLSTRNAVISAGAFAVNILDEDQGELATQFATPAPDKFRGVDVSSGAGGRPLLNDALAQLECRVTEHVDAATHTVFLAEVITARARAGSPLAYFRGTFGRFEQAVDDAVYREVRDRILDRRIGLGEPMTVERMARELSVGRAPVYHSLQKLKAEGVVSGGPEHGYLITPITVDLAWQSYDARAAIECGVVDQVTGSLGREDVDSLRAAADATVPWIRDNAFVDFERFLQTNTAFHERLVSLADNAVLLQAYRRLAVAGVMSRALRGVRATSDRITADHVEIAEAIASSDAPTARRLILEHAALGKRRIKIAIDAVGGEY